TSTWSLWSRTSSRSRAWVPSLRSRCTCERVWIADPAAYADAVRADEREAAELGANGVPFFVLDRKYGVSGAQPAEVFTQALTQAWGERPPLKLIEDGGTEACGPDGCAVPQN
ncbi:DsbA family oxidoreductase, partial [Streptomyces sp. NPDC001226]